MPAPDRAAPASSFSMKRALLSLALALAVPAPALWAQSQVPTLISYSGKVVDAAGNGITAQRTVTFRIWDSATATATANRLYAEQQTVSISGGEFSVLIGAGSGVSGEPNAAGITTVADAFAGSVRYLGITVDDGTAAVDPEMSPRQQIVTTAFAFRAKVAESVAGGSITTAMVANGAVASSQLADAAVSSTKLADSAVLGAKIADGTITTAKIADGAITAAKLAGSIDATKLNDLSVGTPKLADSSVTSAKIVDGTVALADLAPNSVDGGKIVDFSITKFDLAANSVGTGNIEIYSVTAEKLGGGAVDSRVILDGSVGLADLAANSVNASKIVAGSVGRDQLNQTVTSSLSKGRVVYAQAVGAAWNTQETNIGWRLTPFDLGYRKNTSATNPNGTLVVEPDEYLGLEIRYWSPHNHPDNRGYMNQGIFQIDIQTEGINLHADYPNKPYGWTTSFQQGENSRQFFYLNEPTLSSWDMGYADDASYGRLYAAYPGSLANKLPAPWNANQTNQSSNANAGGPPILINIVSMTATGTTGVGRVRYGHAMYVGEKLRFQGLSGTPDLNAAVVTSAANGAAAVTPAADAKEVTITAIPDRYSFEFTLPGGASAASTVTYGGTGIAGAAKVTHYPKANINRAWFATHPHVAHKFVVEYQ